MNSNEPKLLKLTNTCAQCKFYVKDDAPGSLGECHRMPPQVTCFPVGVNKADGSPVINRVVSWSLTEPGNWCGEWKVKTFVPEPHSATNVR